MKKILSLSLALVMAMAIALVGCEENSQDYFNASVIELSKDYLTVICTNPLQTVFEKDTEITIPTDIVAANGLPDVAVEDEIRIVYNKNSVNEERTSIETVFAVYLLDSEGNVIE